MKITIEIDLPRYDGLTGDRHTATDSDWDQLRFVLGSIERKVFLQLHRPASLCDAPEAADQLRTTYGRVVGSITVMRDDANPAEAGGWCDRCGTPHDRLHTARGLGSGDLRLCRPCWDEGRS